MIEPLEHLLSAGELAESLRADVRTGLTARRKWLPPKWFYDDRGSELFDEITRLPEYYPTRAEREILTARAPEIARSTGAKTLVELGSGASDKSLLLLDALHGEGSLAASVALDVSPGALAAAMVILAERYPGLQVRGVVGDFTRHLGQLPSPDGRLLAFLGGTIGNLLPAERAVFLRSVRDALAAGEWFLVGADLVKDPAVLLPAYDDAAGVTAEFNRNVLRVVNRELGADFPVEEFDHVALWDAGHEWIEMRLRARRGMTVHVAELGLAVEFAAGEELCTEISAKFRPDGLRAELNAAGFALPHWWTDAEGRFAVALARAMA